MYTIDIDYWHGTKPVTTLCHHIAGTSQINDIRRYIPKSVIGYVL